MTTLSVGIDDLSHDEYINAFLSHDEYPAVSNDERSHEEYPCVPDS
ncbi:hypothetical protein KC887_00410 [Candidatus Kaiserbacteria bacterium]|nr:hypothetical protein [Candidatus Kaiserbacteria bacterium]